MGENVIIYGVHNSSSAHIDGRKKNVSVLGEGPAQGLAKYPLILQNQENDLY